MFTAVALAPVTPNTPLGDPQAHIGRHDLDTRHPLCHFASLACRKSFPVAGVRAIHIGNFLAGAVSERFSGTQVGEEGAEFGPDVESVGGVGLVFAAEGPGAGGLDGGF